MATDFETGLLVGVLLGEGHFGGDGRQPQVTLRMHVRHEALFRWIERTFPGGRLYGPYHHGGRQYYQWMARGSYLRDEIVPLLARTLSPDLDGYSLARFKEMTERYRSRLGEVRTALSPKPRESGDSSEEPPPATAPERAPLEVAFDLLRGAGN
jgi:hypothetical protein